MLRPLRKAATAGDVVGFSNRLKRLVLSDQRLAAAIRANASLRAKLDAVDAYLFAQERGLLPDLMAAYSMIDTIVRKVVKTVEMPASPIARLDGLQPRADQSVRADKRKFTTNNL